MNTLNYTIMKNRRITKISKNSSDGFTLVELLVVIGVVAVLAALISVGFKIAIGKAQMAKTVGNMRQLATATISYTGSNNGVIPIGDAGRDGGGRGVIWLNKIGADLGFPNLEEQLLNKPPDGNDQWDYMLTTFKGAPFICGALNGTELAKAKKATTDAIGGIGYNATPFLLSTGGSGNANASWNKSQDQFRAPPALTTITHQSSRCMLASSYDWHLFGDARAYNRFGRNKAAMVFWDGSCRIVNRLEFDRAIERPDK